MLEAPNFWFDSHYPTHPNPWANGVGVCWEPGEGWIPIFDLDAKELLADFHGEI